MDDYIMTILNCSKNTPEEVVAKKVDLLLSAYNIMELYSDNKQIKEIAQKRYKNVYSHYVPNVPKEYLNSSLSSKNGLGDSFNNAIASLNNGLNEFNCSNAMNKLLDSIKADPHNIIFQTLIYIISEAERSNR